MTVGVLLFLDVSSNILRLRLLYYILRIRERERAQRTHHSGAWREGFRGKEKKTTLYDVIKV